MERELWNDFLIDACDVDATKLSEYEKADLIMKIEREEEFKEVADKILRLLDSMDSSLNSIDT